VFLREESEQQTRWRRLEATARTLTWERRRWDADLGTLPMDGTYRDESYFSPVSSHASSPLLP
jgi:hypothetical protein